MLCYLSIITSCSMARFTNSLAFQSLSQETSISTIARHKSSAPPFISKSLLSQGSLSSMSEDEGGRRQERVSLSASSTNDLEDEEEQGTASHARNIFFESIGSPFPLVMAPFVNPTNIGIPEFWPTRPAWRAIVLDPVGGETKGGIAYASDGLTDPWRDEEIRAASEKPELGLGFEVIMGSFDLSSDVVLSAVVQVSNILSRSPLEYLPFFISLREDEKQMKTDDLDNDDDGSVLLGTMSLEIEGDDFPEELCHPETGRVGILIDGAITTGLPRTFALPNEEEAHVLELVVLHPQELQHIIVCGLPARMEISRRLSALKLKWCSSSSRQSVVPVPPPNEPLDDAKKVEFVRGWPSK